MLIPVVNYRKSVVHLGEGTRLGQVELVQGIADDGDGIGGQYLEIEVGDGVLPGTFLVTRKTRKKYSRRQNNVPVFTP